MIKKILQYLLTKPIIWLSNKVSSRPKKKRVFESLTALKNDILAQKEHKGPIIDFTFNDKFILFSDQHKGAKNYYDDFTLSERNYLTALAHYNKEKYTYINLGDSEELWKNNILEIYKHNKTNFKAEQQFLDRNAFLKIFGNHDLFWHLDPLASFHLKHIYKSDFKVWEGVVLRTLTEHGNLDIFLTHGHQGDLQSDGNWFSKFFISVIWAPLQAFLRINPNTPAFDEQLKTLHNKLMYKWSSRQRNMILITGHTHQPVFNSLTHLERLYLKLERAIKNKDQGVIIELKSQLASRLDKGDIIPPFNALRLNYFNTGCCCFSDGDITGIEIEKGWIRLIKWEYQAPHGTSTRVVLEASQLIDVMNIDPRKKNIL